MARQALSVESVFSTSRIQAVTPTRSTTARTSGPRDPVTVLARSKTEIARSSCAASARCYRHTLVGT
jgi:hypothetical protein